MKIKSIAAFTAAIILALSDTLFSYKLSAMADEITESNLSKDEIVSAIWEDQWHGHDDDGVTFPEASYYHHILCEWVNDNYGNDDYIWNDTGNLIHSYSRYFNKLTDEWTTYDDDNGNWFITDDTSGKTYHFEYTEDHWNMLDSSNAIADTFDPFSTVAEPEETTNRPVIPEDSENGSKVIIGNEDQAHQKASERAVNHDDNTEVTITAYTPEPSSEASQNDTANNSKPFLYILAAVSGIAAIGGVYIVTKKKG